MHFPSCSNKEDPTRDLGFVVLVAFAKRLGQVRLFVRNHQIVQRPRKTESENSAPPRNQRYSETCHTRHHAQIHGISRHSKDTLANNRLDLIAVGYRCLVPLKRFDSRHGKSDTSHKSTQTHRGNTVMVSLLWYNRKPRAIPATQNYRGETTRIEKCWRMCPDLHGFITRCSMRSGLVFLLSGFVRHCRACLLSFLFRLVGFCCVKQCL